MATKRKKNPELTKIHFATQTAHRTSNDFQKIVYNKLTATDNRNINKRFMAACQQRPFILKQTGENMMYSGPNAQLLWGNPLLSPFMWALDVSVISCSL